MKKLVVLSGAGISAESGLKTFRDAGGLWEKYPVMEVASYEGWIKNPELILQFYNERRKQAFNAKPNKGHTGLAELEKWFDVNIITQNVDNLHEKAGSSKIIHLHGELSKVHSTANPENVKDIGDAEIRMGDLAPDGGQWRPHIVWFGEAVPMIEPAAEEVKKADYFVVIGTSLNVYPAAGLLHYLPRNTPVFVIDPNEVPVSGNLKIHVIRKGAGEGVEILRSMLLEFENIKE